MDRSSNIDVVCFGEVLWDILPSGAVPGGAPMNVAYHLHKLHKNPALITRVGSDEKGNQLKNIFSQQGVCTEYFQTDSLHETGKVYATEQDNHEMVYDIVMPAAWDFIEWHEHYARLVDDAEYFIFGSLAARNTVSKKTLLHLIEHAKNKVFDINLRAPHYNKPVLEELLGKTDLVKLNLAELELVAGWYSNVVDTAGRLRAITDRFKISQAVVTMGSEGAILLTDDKVYNHPGFNVQVKDTVGSGDAFLAGLLSKLMDGARPGEALEFANALGAFIATQQGACPRYEIPAVMKLLQSARN